MRTLGIDIETFSDIDLQKCGVYPYTASPNFEILLLAYAYDGGTVKIVDLARGEILPGEIREALTDDNIIKTAFNAGFERICLSKYINKRLSPKSWRCTAVLCASIGLPLSLEKAAQVLDLSQQKMKEGKELIRYFSIPCKPTKTNNNRTRNHPHHDLAKWELFKAYCKRDVEVEQALSKKLEKYPLIQKEQELYILDQHINDRGVLVDMNLVKKAIECHKQNQNKTIAEAKKITGLHNPNSLPQLKKWLSQKGISVDTLTKTNLSRLAKGSTGEVKRLLTLRQDMAKTSIKKYTAIERALCPDLRVRGLFQFYGANRTGRWAGRLVQVQNLPQNHIKDLTTCRNLLKSGDFDTLELLYPSVPQVLSELIRTAFIPKPGHRLITADFSAVEARVIAWLGGEKWRMDVFSTHGKIYEASASYMFGVPLDEITKDSPLRQKGKISELALGYGGGTGALKAMGALSMGVPEEELPKLVNTWRRANPNIVKLWWAIDKAALKAVKQGIPSKVNTIKIYRKKGLLIFTLPSGRNLYYLNPRIEKNKFGGEAITYEGITATKKWERIETYGPKLVENIVQATARDLLGEAMLRAEKEGYPIVMHCHDEIITEVPEDFGSVEALCHMMAVPPPWAKGLPLRAEGFESHYYKKN